MGKVFVYKCSDYNEENVQKAVEQTIASFDVLKNIKKGTKVVIKANLVSAMSPEKSATVHPVLIKYLTTYLKDKGCEVTVGDSPGGLYTKAFLNHVYNITKMNETGAHLNDDFSVKKAIFNDAKVLKTFDYTGYLDKADIIINFCKLKSHGMMKMSCAVKNLFGTIPGTTKPEYHYRFPNHTDFANMLIDLNEYFKPVVNVVDAIIGMDGNGPTMGNPKKIGCILSAENPYELDYICSKIIGLNMDDVETIKQSYERKLFEPNNITLNDKIENYIIKDFEVKKGHNSIAFGQNEKGLMNKIISIGGNKIFTNKPYCKTKKCIGCGKCASICPAKAITMVNNKPVIDRNKCIKCYCCQEFCPVGAMIVKTSVLAKIINKKSK